MFLKVQKKKKNLIPGLRKELLKSLLKNHDECICGNPINHISRAHLEEWLSYFPPASYKATYDKFKNTVDKPRGSSEAQPLTAPMVTPVTK